MVFVWAVVLLGCDRDNFYSDSSLYENIKETYKDCNLKEIDLLKKKNNIQTLFEDCGSNYISEFDWSPDGSLVYFQLFKGGYILNPENQGVDPVPVGIPLSRGTWLSQNTLVIPVSEQRDGPPELAFYMLGGLLEKYPIPGTAPKDLQALGSDNRLLLSYVDEQGQRLPYTFDRSTAEYTRAFPFITKSIQNIDVAQRANLLSYTDQMGNHLVTKEGKGIADFPKVKRAVPHPEGKYVALEVDGEPISPLRQGEVTYRSKEAKEREEARRKKELEELPDWMPKEVVPPEIHVYNVENNQRYRFLKFYGDNFTWYEAQKYYCSFYLQGIEKQMLNPNVALTDLGVLLLMADNMDMPSGVELVPPKEDE